jgi:DNA-binding MarR family transcriptional regulator
MCALAEAADVAPPTASRMLDSLVKRGIAKRTPAADGDRRRVEVTLTAEGRRLVAAKRARIAQARRQVFHNLTPSERRSAARLLHSLAAAIDDLHP